MDLTKLARHGFFIFNLKILYFIPLSEALRIPAKVILIQ